LMILFTAKKPEIVSSFYMQPMSDNERTFLKQLK